MKKVITYGTYDLLHYGHIRLLERAKALGDYLIVGVTSDDYDKSRGKINNHQNLMERIAAVKATGLADEIIIEEYEGQKIDDIKRFDIDVFTVGSDWEGKFDYLSEYCQVVYLPRTEGISSSNIRSENRQIRLGLVGDSRIILKFAKEAAFVNGGIVTAVYTQNQEIRTALPELEIYASDFEELIENVDGVYILSHPDMHYEQIKYALKHRVHVICESPMATSQAECEELIQLAKKNGLVLMDSIKTAYSTAYSRMLLLIKSGKIGDVLSVDATCTSLSNYSDSSDKESQRWNSMCAWGPTAMLPVFQILGTDFRNKQIVSVMSKEVEEFDLFSRINFTYEKATASVKIGKGGKSEGEMVISGTKGYIYVPAPWWKTDYFEVRFEDPNDNRRYFYQLDGEGIRYEIVAFLKSIEKGISYDNIPDKVTESICSVVHDYYTGVDSIKL